MSRPNVCSGGALPVHTRASRGSSGHLLMAEKRLWVEDQRLPEKMVSLRMAVYSCQEHRGTDHRRATLSLEIWGLPHPWRAMNLTLWGLEEAIPHKGGLRAKDPSQSHCNWNWLINSGSKSLGPWIAGVVYCLLVVMDFLFFYSNLCLQSLAQMTGLSGDETFPWLCSWFGLKLNCWGAISFSFRVIFSFLQMKSSP